MTNLKKRISNYKKIISKLIDSHVEKSLQKQEDELHKRGINEENTKRG